MEAINLRGDLGRQTIQLFSGVAYSYDQGLSFCIRNNIKGLPPSYVTSSDIRNVISIDSCKFEQVQDEKEYNYYSHGNARLISKHFKKLKSAFTSQQSERCFTNRLAVIFVAGIGNSAEASFKVCSKLIGMALSQYENILVVGNCPNSLRESLQERYNSFLTFDFTESLTKQWNYLSQAYHIFSAPVPFAYAHRILDPQKKLTIVNPRDTANIEDFLNDYIFVSELKKYFGGISFAAANYSTKLGISKGNNSPLQRLIDLKSESLSALML